MKKKYTEDDSENEFSVDEPEELEESDDDWTPAANEGRGRRPARRGRQPVSAKKPRLAERNSEEDDEEDEPDEEVEDEEEEEEEEEESQPESDEEANDKGKKRRGRGATTAGGAGRGRAKKVTGKHTESPVAAAAAAAAAVAVRDKEADDDSASAGENVLPTPVEKEFTSGAFVVLKTDFQNQKDPPIWKIDGKALLQKYVPFEQEGKILYRNTSTYSGWSMVLKDRYYPAQITFKMQNRKETVVEFLRDKIKVDDSE